MTETIKGSVVLITGATGAIAQALITELKARGAAKIYAAARDVSSLKTSDGLVPIKMDVTKDDDVAKAVAAAGDVTLLINNAGINHNTAFMVAPDIAIARYTDTGRGAAGDGVRAGASSRASGRGSFCAIHQLTAATRMLMAAAASVAVTTLYSRSR